jgi:flagellar motor protein MotB
MRTLMRRLMWLVLVGLAAAACTNANASDRSAVTGTSRDVVVLVSGTATEPQPALPAEPMTVLQTAAQDRDTSDGPNGKGSTARVVAAAGTYATTFPLTPRRKDGSVEHGLNRDRLIADNLRNVRGAVASVRADEPGLDLIEAMDNATRGATPATLIILSHGLSTRGGFDLRQVGWQADPGAVANDLARRNLLPNLQGWRVIFSGLGATAGAQPPLPRPIRVRLVAYWSAICTKAGGHCEVDDSRLDSMPPTTTTAMPTVPVPGVASVTGPHGEVTYTVTDKLLGFRGDSADLSDEAVDYLKGIATQIQVRLQNQTAARVTVTGYCADPPGSTREGMVRLSRARATNVADALRAAGVHNPIAVIAGGVAPGPSATKNGRFDEARAEQMRRVEITVRNTD